MKFHDHVRPQSHKLRNILAAALLALSLAACRSAQSKAREANADYQLAMASNDIPAGRRALLKLVSAQDDVADNWVELGKLDAQSGNYGGAYYAFTRAHELDRGNSEILRTLTQLALRSGDLSAAQRHARELDLVVPGDPWVKLVNGYDALSHHRFDEAAVASDALLVATPYDSNAVVLKARSLVGRGQNAEAVKLLEDHARSQPADAGSWKLLARLYERSADWRNVTRATGHLLQLAPADRDAAMLFIQSALRSGEEQAARRQSSRLLKPDSQPASIAAVLDQWADYWPSDQRASEAEQLARSAGPLQKIVYAAFLNRINRPADALALARPYASLPVNAGNVEANAVLADALARSGKTNDAGSRLDAVLSFDSGNTTALRSRAELLLHNSQAKLAIADAQKLVTVVPQSARDRLLLSRCYAASGDSKQAARTLWDAFHDIAASEPLFLAIKRANANQPEVMTQIQEEYALQLDANLSRGLL